MSLPKSEADHYTPSELATELVDHGLSSFEFETADDVLSLRVCDPACGIGNLLVETAQYLATVLVEQFGWDKLEAWNAVQPCLLGADLDEDVAAYAQGRIAKAQIRSGDALLELDWPEVDAVIANPPFMGARHMSRVYGSDYVRQLKQRWPAQTQTDLAVYFLRLGGDIARTSLAYLTTNSINAGHSRSAGLQVLVRDGWTIQWARTDFYWPGEADVYCSSFHMDR